MQGRVEKGAWVQEVKVGNFVGGKKMGVRLRGARQEAAEVVPATWSGHESRAKACFRLHFRSTEEVTFVCPYQHSLFN
jgi:hypothetical protein